MFTVWVRARFVNYKKGAAARYKVYQLIAHDQCFSPDIPASSTTKTGRRDIVNILLKVALSTKNQNQVNQINYVYFEENK